MLYILKVEFYFDQNLIGQRWRENACSLWKLVWTEKLKWPISKIVCIGNIHINLAIYRYCAKDDVETLLIPSYSSLTRMEKRTTKR